MPIPGRVAATHRGLRAAHEPVPGVSRWAPAAALLIALSVVPSSVWRIAAVTFDAPIYDGARGDGALPSWLPVELYVVLLSVVSELLASAAYGLIAAWGETVPRWVPGLGGRRIQPLLVVATGGAAAVILTAVWTTAAVTSTFGRTIRGDRMDGTNPWNLETWEGLAFVGAYAPLLLWGPLLGLLTLAYHRRRKASSVERGAHEETDSVGGHVPRDSMAAQDPPAGGCEVVSHRRGHPPVLPHDGVARPAVTRRSTPNRLARAAAWGLFGWMAFSAGAHLWAAAIPREVVEAAPGPWGYTAYLVYDLFIVLLSAVGMLLALSWLRPWGGRLRPVWILVPAVAGSVVLAVRGVPGLLEVILVGTGVTPRGLWAIVDDSRQLIGHDQMVRDAFINTYFFVGAVLIVPLTLRYVRQLRRGWVGW